MALTPTPLSSRLKLTWLDGILLAALAAAGTWIWLRSSIGIAYDWNWAEALETINTPDREGGTPYFYTGVIATLRLSLWSAMIATVLGVLIGLGRRSGISSIRVICSAYIQMIRNMPPLVFIFIFYFFISNQLIPVMGLENVLRVSTDDQSSLSGVLFGPAHLWENLLSGVLCISFIGGAYIAEIVRAGIGAIPSGQWEAAESLGLKKLDRYRFVIFPQAFARIVPPLTGQYISLVKDSSIVSLISIQELTFVGTEIANSSGLIFETWIFVGLVYFLLCLVLSLGLRFVERRVTVHFHLAA